MQWRAVRVFLGAGTFFLISIFVLYRPSEAYSQEPQIETDSGNTIDCGDSPESTAQSTGPVILGTAPDEPELKAQESSGETTNNEYVPEEQAPQSETGSGDTAASRAGDHVPVVGAAAEAWRDWPQSANFRITLEYRNYTYLQDESRGSSRDSINEGRLRIEYDNQFRDNMRLYLNLLNQADDDDFTNGFFDLEEDELKRSYVNFVEAFVDLYFESFDLRLGKQIINWGIADVFNPTDNLTPTDYSNLLDQDDIGVLAANANLYWNNWNLQLVGIPLFAPSRLPPRGTRFSLYPPDSPIPIEDPELPPNTLDNAQFGVRLKTTYHGWDFSAGYYDGINDIPNPELRFEQVIIPPSPEPVNMPYVLPVYNRMRVFGGGFATVFDKLGVHGEAAQFVFDGDTQDSYFQYVIGFDYTKSDIILDNDLFVIVEYVGLSVTDRGNMLETGTTPLDRVFTSAIATRIRYEFSDFTWLEIKGGVDFYKGDDYYVQPQLVHLVNDNLTLVVGLDVMGGPEDTFFGQFEDNDRIFGKIIYTF